MRSIVVVGMAVFSFAAGQAVAGQGSCEVIGILAKSVMSARQGGVPMQDVLGHGGDSKEVDELTRLLAIAAYEQPRFSSKDYQDRATTEFQNQMYLACMKGGN